MDLSKFMLFNSNGNLCLDYFDKQKIYCGGRSTRLHNYHLKICNNKAKFLTREQFVLYNLDNTHDRALRYARSKGPAVNIYGPIFL